MQKRKYFVYKGFRHITYYCRNRRKIKKKRRAEIGRPEYQPLSNRFEVLMNRVIKTEISIIEKEKKEKLLREVTVKIGLKQEDDEDRITMKALLDNRVTGLIISSEFARKNKFKKKSWKN